MINSSFPVSSTTAANYSMATSGPSRAASSTRGASVLSALTASDRQLLQDSTGVSLNANGVDGKGRALAPAVAFNIAHDRQSGKLPAGQPITTTYLRDMIQNLTSGAGAPSDAVDTLNKMIDTLARRGGTERLDLRT